MMSMTHYRKVLVITDNFQLANSFLISFISCLIAFECIFFSYSANNDEDDSSDDSLPSWFIPSFDDVFLCLFSRSSSDENPLLLSLL